MEDDQYIKAYSLFRVALKQVPLSGELVTYDWPTMPRKIPVHWMVYFEMLSDYSRELANILNQFLTYIDVLTAWDKVFLDYEEEDRLYLIHEFVEPICTICLNLPYVIRSRFIFFVTHLCHQANISLLGKKWKDDLPEDQCIDFKKMDKVATKWLAYKQLRLSMGQLADKKHQAEVNNYRHKFQHRYPPRIEVGLSEIIKRNINEAGRVSYAIGYSLPLRIGQITSSLKGQHAAAMRVYKCYQELVNEQLGKIMSA